MFVFNVVNFSKLNLYCIYFGVLNHYFVKSVNLSFLQYGDGAGNTAEENSSVLSLVRMH